MFGGEICEIRRIVPFKTLDLAVAAKAPGGPPATLQPTEWMPKQWIQPSTYGILKLREVAQAASPFEDLVRFISILRGDHFGHKAEQPS